jgi:cell division protein FtsL
MAQNRRYAPYVQGSAVRKAMPAEQERPKLRKVTENEGYARHLNNRARQRANAAYTCVMIAALIVVFAVCVRYLALQSEVSEKADILSDLEQTYNKLKSDNDYMEVYIDSNIDYDHILDVAVNELGMVYAKSSQVVSYESEDIEYVKQYAQIPR